MDHDSSPKYLGVQTETTRRDGRLYRSKSGFVTFPPRAAPLFRDERYNVLFTRRLSQPHCSLPFFKSQSLK
ncbi:hypothetical protein J6590_028734 [Homalodisca vitripennis]|nr:hypothetical protein J6590_028734 [Homalodisca vitripennis]